MRGAFDPSLYLVTDEGLAGGRPLGTLVRLAIEGGVTAVQLREKEGSLRRILETARALRVITREAGVPLVVNDRLDVALAVDADGLHVGAHDLPPAEARRLLGGSRILGVTVGDPEAARKAVDDGADYLGTTAVFATTTKRDAGAPLGLSNLARIVRAVPCPVVAIGGIRAGNAPAVLATGVAGIAVVSAIVGADDPRAAARELARQVALAREAGT